MAAVLLAAAIVVALALFFNFTNGFNDSASQVATVVTSNTFSPLRALLLAASGNFIGAYFLGTAVAETLGRDIVDPTFLNVGHAGVAVIAAALVGAIVWNLGSWYFGIPSSSSHALIGGLLGAFLASWGFAPIHWLKVLFIFLAMLISPFVGFIFTYLFTRLTLGFSVWLTPKANKTFKNLQYISLAAQSLSHGTNDAQKTMGVITFALVILGLYKLPPGAYLIPGWVVILCALAMSLGTFFGGQKIIKTLGAGLYKVRPIHSFASQVASSAVIYLAAILGYPISTTQVISSSVMGAGAAFRPKMVRWQVAKEMALAWLITIPLSAVVAAGGFFAIQKIFL